MGSPSGSESKESTCNAGDPGSIHGLEDTGEGNDNPLQYFCLEFSMDRVPWQATANGVAKIQTWLEPLTLSLSSIIGMV